jgi:hypothetical protein
MDPKLRRSMKLPPRAVPGAGMAFGKGRLGVLVGDAVIVRDTHHFAEIARLPLDGPRALVSLADGSLFAVGASRSLQLQPQDTAPRGFRRLPLLPGASLFGDRRSPDRVWVLQGLGEALFGYDLAITDSPLLPTREWVELTGDDRRAFGSLRDGSFLYSTPTGFLRFFGPKKTDSLAGDASGVWRLLPASRPDTVWALARRGAGLFRILDGRLARLKALELEADPYDADAAGEYLAVLELLQPTDAPWAFVLEVFDVRGKRRLRATLPAAEQFGEDWVASLDRDRGLAMTADPPLVAVGGPGALSVWAADRGDLVHTEP